MGVAVACCFVSNGLTPLMGPKVLDKRGKDVL